MRAAVVDDDSTMRSMLHEYLDRYSAENHIELSVTEFDSGDTFLNEYHGEFDVLFFDVEMPGTDGLDTARRLRCIDSEVNIIFVTNMAQYAICGYEVEALDYILKPLSYYDFALKFQKVLRRVTRSSSHTLAVEAVDGICRLDTADICYIEVLGHYLVYHLNDNKEIRARGRMEQVAEALATYGFVRIHKSYLVNLRYLELLKPTMVTLKAASLPVGRAYKEPLMQAYLKYQGG